MSCVKIIVDHLQMFFTIFSSILSVVTNFVNDHFHTVYSTGQRNSEKSSTLQRLHVLLRCGDSMVAHQTSEAEVPGSNPAQ